MPAKPKLPAKVAPASPSSVQAEPKAPATPAQVLATLSQEYVRGNGSGITEILNSFGGWGAELCEEEIADMERDAIISSNYELLVETVLADEGRIVPLVTNEEAANYEEAQEAARLCRFALECLETDLPSTFEQLLSALKVGVKVAESTFQAVRDDDGQLVAVPVSIKVKPRNSLQFVVDEFMNIVGFTTAYATGGEMRAEDTILPRQKFLVFSYKPKDENPQGTSAFLSVVSAFRHKRKIWPLWSKFLSIFAMPALHGTPSEKSSPEPQFDADGQPMIDPVTQKPIVLTPEHAMLQSMLQWTDGTVIVTAPGSTIKAIETKGDGAAFVQAFRHLNMELSTGLLRQSRATNEAEHGSKADSQTGQELFATYVAYLKTRLAIAFRRDVLRVIVWLNMGPDAARRSTPLFFLGDADRFSWAEDATAIAAIADSLTDSQLDSVTGQAGIPAPLKGETRPARGKQAGPIAPNSPAIAPAPKPDDPTKGKQ